jgi:hypothetical protein
VYLAEARTLTSTTFKRNNKRRDMASLSSWEKHDILRCERFLKRIEGWVDPTWGFYVYGTYTRPQKRKDSDKGSDEGESQEKAGESY